MTDHHIRRYVFAHPSSLDFLGGVGVVAAISRAKPSAFADLAHVERYQIGGGDECLVLFDLRLDMQRALEVQKTLVNAGATVVFVGVEPGTVRIGPVVMPGEGRCLDCLGQRIQSNHPIGKAYVEDVVRSRPLPYKPLSPASRTAIVGLMSTLLEGALGREWSALPVGSYYTVRIDSLEIVRHRFIQVTHCPSCDVAPTPTSPEPLRFEPRIKRSPWDKRPPNEKLSLLGARRMFVDRHCGLIKHVFQNMQSDLMPLFTSERAFAGGGSTDYNHGRAFNYQTSELIAILEGVERYAGNEPRDGLIALRGSRSQMVSRFGDRVVDPAAFIMHTPEQQADPLFRFEAYTEDLECGWIWGHSIRRAEPILVPEQLAYYNIKSRPGAPTNRFIYDSSNGGSLGGSLEEAVLGGLHEVVERDAYFSTWYSRIAPVRIDKQSIDDRRSAALIARSEAAGFEVHLFDMTSEARIPVVGAMIVDPSADARIKSYCASACEGRWGGAIFSALAEVTTSMGVYRKNETLDFDRARAMLEDHALVKDMFDHVLLYSLNESFERLRFLLDGDMRTLQECRERVPDALQVDLTQELQADCAKVLEVAVDIIVVDQTFSELRELGLGAAKVLVPGMMPVTFGHQYRRIDMDRLDRFARFRGLPDAKFTPANVNPYPHNFP
ncbi:TOMM precursor leader peptide-binding protein [Lysobacter sp. cf310]|uniref:TOMM precursor leader peptide-binding protein n=1 Tax=Lysobacter sp. cf310 TaxID=1761790 RepID=UPI0008E96EB0|nr:TOMM precursor leader peptide-binding protein [Lysobacter sp. cf310]SFK95050.1 ribosomal protein S12 methylthiotransferase accessory factor [Lysobacter sp. cf310]